jgi:hypothetical protein
MNNFCTCGTDSGYDFDASDHDSYWMCESAVVPDGTKCCECGASIPAGSRRSCATHYEVYEPEGEPPIPPDWDTKAAKAMSEDEWDAMYEALDEFQDTHGWNGETERYERETGTDFRCDRCEGEVEILAQFEICVNAPGDLPGAHEEHYWQKHRRRIRWRPGPDGVWHPRPWRLIDYARHYRRRAYWLIRSEWAWKFKFRLKKLFLWKVERVLNNAVQRERWKLRQWKWQMQKVTE